MEDNLNILCYGAGVNSVALLLECTSSGIYFDAILFADTGGERNATYHHLEIMREWCRKNHQPVIEILRFKNQSGQAIDLYTDCVSRYNLPGIVYGQKNCSLKFKRGPQDVWLNNWPPAKAAWDQGKKVNKFVGFDADERHRTYIDFNDKKYNCIYKLVHWNWGREECIQRIRESDIPVPAKSSCTFCPSMKVHEIIDLYTKEPGKYFGAVEMERLAMPNLVSIKGLGRSWSWWELIIAYRYFELLKKNPTPSGSMSCALKRMLKRINRALSEKELKTRDAKSLARSLFPTGQETPCECYDGQDFN